MAFRKNFIWCVGGAAAQQDGGYLDDGKGLNIWDALSDGHIKNNDTTFVACDHYHRWKEDLQLVKKIGVNSYRFSISMARIYPTDEFTVNEQGVKFYVDLVAECKRLGLEPICTLYHWDMPLWLYRKGGWKSPLAVEWFARYVKTVVEAIGDKVGYWITFNEPQCFVAMGYGTGEHAPFEKCDDRTVQAISRNVMLAHGAAVKVIRATAKRPPKISFAPTAGLTMPKGKDDADAAYAHMFDIRNGGAFNAAWWSDPIVLGVRPNGCDWLSDEDLQEICQPLDFYAYNIYNAGNPKGFECEYVGIPRTDMGWPITPDCMYWAAKFFHKRYGLPIMVTENGMANVDFVFDDGKVHDPQRVDYLHKHIASLRRAADEGIPVIGYSCWSFMDNFEWAEGYSKRFGLVYVDYRTQKRTLKDSAYAYRAIIEKNGEI